jgi:hypothetical protein
MCFKSYIQISTVKILKETDNYHLKIGTGEKWSEISTRTLKSK